MAVASRTPLPCNALYTDVRPHSASRAKSSAVHPRTTSANRSRVGSKRPVAGFQMDAPSPSGGVIARSKSGRRVSSPSARVNVAEAGACGAAAAETASAVSTSPTSRRHLGACRPEFG